MIEEAAAFAAQAHHGTFRKGTQIPYITHPMEAAVIVSGFTDDPEMIAAALLHDVVEDTGVTEEEIRERFGSRVACLVANETEDKTKSWRERKGATIQHLKSAPRSWLLGISSAICVVRQRIIWFLGMKSGSGLMKRIRPCTPGITGGLQMHWMI